MHEITKEFEQIQSICLDRMLPKVFENESIPDSEIWKQKITFRRGERWLIEAVSGGGKSSACAYILGLRRDYLGKLLMNDIDVSNFSIDTWQRIRRMNIAYLPQELALFPELTALQNIELKASLTSEIDRERVEEWLHRLGIDSRANYPVGKMSIGQQQRVAIIRSVCQPFDFILLDEPVSHLDDENNRIAAAIIEEEALRRGAAVIATSVGNPIKIEGLKKVRL